MGREWLQLMDDEYYLGLSHLLFNLSSGVTQHQIERVDRLQI